MSSKRMLWVGAVLGALSVTLGAFGAHYLEPMVGGKSLEPDVWLRMQQNWEVASRYLMYHALAIVACGLLAHSRPSLALNIACWFFLIGAAIFCGMIYVLVLTQIRWLGAIVPIGGVLMIFGWIALAYAGGGCCSRECAAGSSDAGGHS
jgi:uncharacterized membrane protein YgdD (TMEM256/DUF423 family)